MCSKKHSFASSKESRVSASTSLARHPSPAWMRSCDSESIWVYLASPHPLPRCSRCTFRYCCLGMDSDDTKLGHAQGSASPSKLCCSANWGLQCGRSLIRGICVLQLYRTRRMLVTIDTVVILSTYSSGSPPTMLMCSVNRFPSCTFYLVTNFEK